MTAPSYEQLAALMAAQERIIAELRARIVEQDLRTRAPQRLTKL